MSSKDDQHKKRSRAKFFQAINNNRIQITMHSNGYSVDLVFSNVPNLVIAFDRNPNKFTIR